MMNLPEYLKAIEIAATEFEEAVEEARRDYRNKMNNAKNLFFEPQDGPMELKKARLL